MHIGLSLGINNPVPRTTSGGVTPPLDDYTGAQTAWSVARKLRTAYSGSLIRVRRDSDNAEQDIGFDSNGNLDESALTTFVGAGSGYITTAYDQSGNGNDWTQATSTKQYQIVISGVIVKQNSKPALKKVTSAALSLSGTFGATNTMFYVATSDGNYIAVCSNAAGSAFYGISNSGSASLSYAKAGAPTNYVNGSLIGNTRNDMYTATANSQAIITIENLDLSNPAWTELVTDYGVSTVLESFEYVQEKILYNSDKSSDRAAIETNINDYYGIY